MKITFFLLVIYVSFIGMVRADNILYDVRYVACGRFDSGEFDDIELLGKYSGRANGFIEFILQKTSPIGVRIMERDHELAVASPQELAKIPFTPLPDYCLIAFDENKKPIYLISPTEPNYVGVSGVRMVVDGVYQIDTKSVNKAFVDENIYKRLSLILERLSKHIKGAVK